MSHRAQTAESDATLPAMGDALTDVLACWKQRAIDAEARERSLVEENRALRQENARLRATFGVVRVG